LTVSGRIETAASPLTGGGWGKDEYNIISYSYPYLINPLGEGKI